MSQDFSKNQENLLKVLNYPSKTHFWEYLVSIPLRLLFLYGIPMFVCLASILTSAQSGLPETVTNILPPLAWVSSLFYATCSAFIWTVCAILIVSHEVTKKKPEEMNSEEFKKWQDFCDTLCSFFAMFSFNKLAVLRRALFGFGAAVCLWSGAFYITGFIYFSTMVANTVALFVVKAYQASFVKELSETEVLRLIEKPWKNKNKSANSAEVHVQGVLLPVDKQ